MVVELGLEAHLLAEELVLQVVLIAALEVLHRDVPDPVHVDHYSVLLDVEVVVGELDLQLLGPRQLPAHRHLHVVLHLLQAGAELRGLPLEVGHGGDGDCVLVVYGDLDAG